MSGLRAGSFAIVAAIVSFLVIAGLRYDFWAEVYSTREFTMSERVMTQLRALWWYLGRMGAPRVSSPSLYDDWLTSTSWLSPWTTTLAAGAWLTLVCDRNGLQADRLVPLRRRLVPGRNGAELHRAARNGLRAPDLPAFIRSHPGAL